MAIRLPLIPLGWFGADAVEVQSQSGDDWTLAVEVSEDLGTFPDYVTSVEVEWKESSIPVLRYRWKAGQVTDTWSGAWSPGDLAPDYLFCVELTDVSRSQYVRSAKSHELQTHIGQAKRLLDLQLGPFTTTKEGWEDAIRRAMIAMVEFQLMTEDPQTLTFLTGLAEERIGSYQYERNTSYAGNLEDHLGTVPDHVRAMLLDYIDAEAGEFVAVTELEIFERETFPPVSPWASAEEEMVCPS